MYFPYFTYSYNKLIIMKQCTKCKETKESTDFHKHPTMKLQSWCKSCQLEFIKAYYQSDAGKAYLKDYRQNNPAARAAAKRFREKNKEKTNQWVYDWYNENTDKFVKIQNKYQSKIPPSVYCIKYDDEVIYVGSSKKPLARVNIHLSTIKTATNLSKVNKLHSYCDYDKSRFKYEYLEQCDVDKLIEREHYWEKELNAKGNYKRIFGRVKSVTQIMKEQGTYFYKKRGL